MKPDRIGTQRDLKLMAEDQVLERAIPPRSNSSKERLEGRSSLSSRQDSNRRSRIEPRRTGSTSAALQPLPSLSQFLPLTVLARKRTVNAATGPRGVASEQEEGWRSHAGCRWQSRSADGRLTVQAVSDPYDFSQPALAADICSPATDARGMPVVELTQDNFRLTVFDPEC